MRQLTFGALRQEALTEPQKLNGFKVDHEGRCTVLCTAAPRHIP